MAGMPEAAKTRSYTGSCHCGAVRFRFRSEPITSGLRCNCSMCMRKGTIMSDRPVLPEDVEELVGLATLGVYQWGDKDVYHYFCKTCGICPFHAGVDRERAGTMLLHGPSLPGFYRMNLGCVHDLDALALAISVVDGRSF